MRKRRSLWWGTLTLTGAALASRGLGLIYRMLLSRFLGSEGLGFFQMIFPFYIALVTLAIAGTPVAVSQLVAEEHVNRPLLVRRALTVVFVTSLPLIAFVIFGAKPLAMILYHDMRFVPLLVTLAPALIAVGFSAVLRGYFVGVQRLRYPAVSQVAEQLSRVVILYTILNVFGQHAFSNAPLVAVALIPLGEGISLIILGLAYYRSLSDDSLLETKPVFVSQILRLSIPVTLSRLLGSLVGVIEAFLIPWRLEMAGMSTYNAIRYFGQLTGMALPLILFPTALSMALATNLIPIVAQAQSHHDQDSIRLALVESLNTTALFTIPVTIFLLAFGVRLDDLFFHAHIPSNLFYPLALGGFFLYFDITLAGALRGLGRTDLPMRNDLIASGIELALIWLFTMRLELAPHGIAVAIAIGFAVSPILNTLSIKHLTHISIPWFRILISPLMSTIPALMALTLWHLWSLPWHINPLIHLVVGMLLTLGTYGLSLTMTGRSLKTWI
ncbi:stage V sporulation protein B [Sulfobacillus thermosulfidooxidans DSM 9293]|uniref:Stage V sporulation protein B n=1 Tax=Sulfobacillus thermosulfidooxidans (strain DSM 9293 / VKM B-1269 / AT-1) TaxID=929705 RepID=A0A1W1WN45_SULTA|nr:polysaccharide biosynthesis protein [Sulfobacillus thermosulfidooxidans]SMC07450.1 stage V sporulation protein B [Sulfobacillus thermosulfidooxidans DSM 9293]